SDLDMLAEEIRDLIVTTVSRTGGHLAPSLGAVELTLALHRVFDSPRDKIIWDVGHQSYAHKILTGRRDQFHTLRQFKGISGFPRIEENPHDIFGAGHSSTSISVAVGLAAARDFREEKHKVIAVIGDGALTGGMAFEALNHAGSLNMDLIVILNDNEMSISPNVGGMSKYLSRIITGQFYNQAKVDIEDFVNRLPRIGPKLKRLLNRMEESLKGFIVPGVLFEELGFRYFGPIDGHNMPLLVETFSNLQRIGGPVLLHVITRKGKGYVPAEEHPTHFHGTGPFDKVSGEPKKSSKDTYTDVFGRVVTRLAATDRRVVVITPAMTVGSGLVEYAQQFPDRFFDVGIAEQHATTLAGGLARGGMKPILAIYSTFLQRAYDQVFHDVCLQNQPVVFAIDRAGLVGPDGATHQGVFDISYLRVLPNLTVMAPMDEVELEMMLSHSLSINSPVAIRYPRDYVEQVTESQLHHQPLQEGKALVVRDGKDVAIWAVGPLVYRVLDALPILEKAGVRPVVVNPRYLKPVDDELICRQARKGFRIVTFEEHALAGGFGSVLLETLEQRGIADTPVLRLGIPDCFVEHGTRDQLLKLLQLDTQSIAERIIRFVNEPVSISARQG
ncbi:MAG TPA: 1-deoxy-D-xylulose-5-phosphate synthase, partial [bacterium]|nr:1-deoxy-D-xylulose-5-phosphate synthase [bacterium]